MNWNTSAKKRVLCSKSKAFTESQSRLQARNKLLKPKIPKNSSIFSTTSPIFYQNKKNEKEVERKNSSGDLFSFSFSLNDNDNKENKDIRNVNKDVILLSRLPKKNKELKRKYSLGNEDAKDKDKDEEFMIKKKQKFSTSQENRSYIDELEYSDDEKVYQEVNNDNQNEILFFNDGYLCSESTGLRRKTSMTKFNSFGEISPYISNDNDSSPNTPNDNSLANIANSNKFKYDKCLNQLYEADLNFSNKYPQEIGLPLSCMSQDEDYIEKEDLEKKIQDELRVKEKKKDPYDLDLFDGKLNYYKDNERLSKQNSIDSTKTNYTTIGLDSIANDIQLSLSDGELDIEMFK